MPGNLPDDLSLADRLTRLRLAAEYVEALAAEYHVTLQPLRDALQAVANVPLEARDQWTDAVHALAERLSAEDMGGTPAELQKIPRWAIQFEGPEPGSAFVGQAFVGAVAGAIEGGASTVEFFATLDRYDFITGDVAVSEICAVLSHLLFRFTDRTAPRFVERFTAVLSDIEMSSETLSFRLTQFRMPLSAAAKAAIHEWNECRTGQKYYHVGIRPSAPVAAPPDMEQTDEEQPSPNAPTAEADETGGEKVPTDTLPTGTKQGEGAKPTPNATTEAILPVLLSASDIANRMQKNPKSVTSFLSRFAEKNPDCRVVTESKRKNEPGYLYRTADVWPALEKWMKDSGELKHD